MAPAAATNKIAATLEGRRYWAFDKDKGWLMRRQAGISRRDRLLLKKPKPGIWLLCRPPALCYFRLPSFFWKSFEPVPVFLETPFHSDFTFLSEFF
jgi:hypothetical protein